MGFKPTETLLQLGRAYELQGDCSQAIAAYRQILAHDPHHINGHRALAHAYEVCGCDHEAKTAWLRLLNIAHDDLLARKRLMCLSLMDRDPDAAIRLGEEGVKKGFVDPELYRLLSLAYRTTRDRISADRYLALSES